MAKMVNTVCGPIPAERLGRTYVHEHSWYGYPGWYGQTMYEYDTEEIMDVTTQKLEKAKSQGLETFVCVTTNDTCLCPRSLHAEMLKEVSERSEVNIVMSTGYTYEGAVPGQVNGLGGGAQYWKLHKALGMAEEELYELLMHEITEGVGKTGIKAGVLKFGTSDHLITEIEELYYRTGARIMNETGTCLVSHTEVGSMAHEQVELLESEGVNLGMCAIGHANGNLDPAYHKYVMDKGAFVAFDRLGIQNGWGLGDERKLYPLIAELIKSGYSDRLLLSQDSVQMWLGKQPELPPEMSGWHLCHIVEDVIPPLKCLGVTDSELHQILVENPSKMFSSEPNPNGKKGPLAKAEFSNEFH
jgi:phosphotriesterase-related protein